MHLYPRLRDVMGDPKAGATPPTKENAEARLNAMMARVDDGVNKILQDIEHKLPGKELWITEWNSCGANPVIQRSDTDEPMSPAMQMLVAVRMELGFLRHPSVTAALFFMYSFKPKDAYTMFIPDNKGGYTPALTTVVLNWLSEAANSSNSFQRFVHEGEQTVPGGGAKKESFLPVEGGLFESPERTVLLVQNVSSKDFSLDPSTSLKGKKLNRVETLAVSDLSDTKFTAAKIETQNLAGTIRIPPYSFTRIITEGN